MKKIIWILLFVFVVSICFANDLDSNKYVINKYALNYDERETVKIVVVAGVLVVMTVLLVILTMDMTKTSSP